MSDKRKERKKLKGMPKKILSLVLVFSLIMPLFLLTGCEQNLDEFNKITVDYNAAGEYTIKIKESDFLSYEKKDGSNNEVSVKGSVDKPTVAFKDITKDDIFVDYYYGISDEVADENHTDDASKHFKEADIIAFENDGNEITLSYRDAFAKENLTDAYVVNVDKNNAFVNVEVLFPVNDLSSNTTEVSSEATENTITITSGGSNFSPGISADDIAFDYSFRDMKVESLSVDGKNLTMKIVGKPVLDLGISPAYTDGIIIVKSTGFEKAVYDEEIGFDVKLPLYDVDTQNITGGNGRWNVPINVSGVDTSNIKPEDISFGENTKVTNVTQDDGKIIAEVEADNMDDIGGEVSIGDIDFLCDYSHACFIVLPYSFSKNDEDFELKVGLWAQSGTFPEGIKESDFELLDGFESGTIKDLDYIDEKEVTLIVKVPSNGISLEDMDIIGTIGVKEGVMKEDWGDPAPAFSCSADYRNDDFQIVDLKKYNTGSLDFDKNIDIASIFDGSVVYAAENNNNNNNDNNNNANEPAANENSNASKDDVKNAIKESTKDKNKKEAADKAVNYTVDKIKQLDEGYGKIAEYVRVVYNYAKGFITGNPVDIVTGTINLIEIITAKNEAQNPYALKSLDEKVDELLALNKLMDAKLDKVVKNQYKGMIQGYENALDALSTDCSRAEAMLRTANDMYVAGGGKVPTNDSSIDDIKAYNKALIEIIMNEEKKGNSAFRGYTELIKNIEKNYKLVTTETYKSWDRNPIFYYDSLWAEYYNYDSQSYVVRRSYRGNITYQIARSYSVLSFYYEIPANTEQYADLTKRMEKSIETINEHPATSPPPKTEAELQANPVYSTTLRRSVNGFDVIHDGVGFDPYKGNRPFEDHFKQIYGKQGPYDISDNDVKKYKERIHTNEEKRVWKDLVEAFPYLNDKTTVASLPEAPNSIRIVKKNVPITSNTFGLKMGGKWGKSKVRWHSAPGKTVDIGRVPQYYTKYLNWNSAERTDLSWDAEYRRTGYTSFVQFRFK